MAILYTEDLSFDREHIWHPYTSMTNPLPTFMVKSANGVNINLVSGEQIIDGMSSWWSVLHGYNHPVLNNALIEQSKNMSHVMFGGLTHKPAIDLCKNLIRITPEGLDKVFLSDSGSVAVEVAMKMAIQYWVAKEQPNKNKMLTVKNGYHGDTFATMAVSDPVTGMHHMFNQALTQHYFAPAPQIMIDEQWNNKDVAQLTLLFKEHHNNIAAFIIEPIVQGTGGMRFYHPEYLKACRSLCNKYNVLLIADEIATGLGRTGKLFACEWADISPDIMCLGKTLTGGYITLAATLCTNEIAEGISESEAGCFMHGPTFMGNPLACAVANASIGLLESSHWKDNIQRIESYLTEHLIPLAVSHNVQQTRVLGGIGVVETTSPVNMAVIQKRFVELGVWIRPFGKLIYIMPPLISTNDDLQTLVDAIATVLNENECFS